MANFVFRYDVEEVNDDTIKTTLGKYIYKACEVLIDIGFSGDEVTYAAKLAKAFIKKLKDSVKDNAYYFLYKTLMKSKLELKDTFDPLILVLCSSRPTPELFKENSLETYKTLKGKYGDDVDSVLELICAERNLPSDDDLFRAVQSLCK